MRLLLPISQSEEATSMEDIIAENTGTELVQASSSGADSVGPSEDEQRLADEIAQLWEVHAQAKNTVKKTKEELKAIRELLSERLYELKQVLARPGRNGQWSAWLKERKISRATADRLVQRYGANLPGFESPHEAISNPSEDTAEKLARVVWSRFRKVLTSEESVIQFIDRIAELSGVGHEQRAEGLVIFKPAPTAAEESPATAPAIDPAPQPSDEVSVITEEPAHAPVQDGQAAAAADASNGDAA
jgi:hypothetical protein